MRHQILMIRPDESVHQEIVLSKTLDEYISIFPTLYPKNALFVDGLLVQEGNVSKGYLNEFLEGIETIAKLKKEKTRYEKKLLLLTELKNGDQIQMGDRFVPKNKGIKGGVVCYTSESDNCVGIKDQKGKYIMFNMKYNKNFPIRRIDNQDDLEEYFVVRKMK